LDTAPDAPRSSSLGWSFALAVALASALFLLSLRGHYALDTSDEGFLWYGAVHAAEGEVPLRDFYSYDPGRYYFSAAYLLLKGNKGIVALRESCLLFEILGLTLGLATLRRAGLGWLSWALAGLPLALWTWPPFRTFDSSIPLAGVYVACLLIERASRGRLVASGAFVGLAAVFGRNHGLYALAALAPVLLGLFSRDRPLPPLVPRLSFFALGVFLGFSPVLLMAAFVPGFGRAFYESLVFTYQTGHATGLNFPTPFPWRPRYGRYALGFPFLLLPALYAFLAVGVWRRRIREPALLASLLFGIFYLDSGYSRPDLLHLATAAQPALLAVLALPASGPRVLRTTAGLALPLLLLLGSWPSVGQQWLSGPMERGSKKLMSYEVGSDTLVMKPWAAGFLGMAKEVHARAAPKEAILALPYAPGLYPVLGVRSPLYDLLFVRTRGLEEQRLLTTQMDEKAVAWIFYVDIAFQGVPPFPKSHPVVWEFIQREFEEVPMEGPRECRVFHRRGQP
jgi:hypothetical protein